VCIGYVHEVYSSELAPKGIRVNSINPAGVRTNIFAAMGYSKEDVDNLLEQRAKSYPLGRVGEPIDLANYVLFLASDECSWITGSSFLADGGGLFAPSSSSPVQKK